MATRDTEGGHDGEGAFRVAVIYQVFAKGRQLLKQDEPPSART